MLHRVLVALVGLALLACSDESASGTLRGELRLNNPTFAALVGDAQDSWPMAGTVVVVDSSGDEVVRHRIGREGTFSIELPEGTYDVRSVDGEDDFLCDSAEVVVSEQHPVDVVLLCPTI